MRAVVRCDATREIGFGHLSRCLALAEALRLCAVDSTFVGQFDPAAEHQIAFAGFRHHALTQPVNSGSRDCEALSSLADVGNASFFVVDSYRADETYLETLKSSGSPVVMIDDFRSLTAYPCDVVLNFTWGAATLGYPAGPHLLLGPKYFLARRRFAELRPRSIGRTREGGVQNVLIAIGGSDPKGIAARAIGILRRRHSGLCLRVIGVSETDSSDMLTNFAVGSSVLPRQPDLAEQLLWADAAIAGGGLTKYESAYMGVPVAVISQNEGQATETRSLARAGLVLDVGLADECSDAAIGSALDEFFANGELRDSLARRMRGTFGPDTTLHAARAILAEVGRHGR